MKQNLKPLLIAAFAALSIGAGLLYASGQKNASQSEKSAPQTAKIAAEGFVPGSHPGVMVRHVPQENPHAKTPDEASIFKKPGAARPTRILPPGTRTAPVIRKGQSAKGGTAASLPDSRLPLTTAHKDKTGKIVVE